jgi:hypothetical protein
MVPAGVLDRMGVAAVVSADMEVEDEGGSNVDISDEERFWVRKTTPMS